MYKLFIDPTLSRRGLFFKGSQEMIKTRLNIPFKGNRDYLQGPDIFEHVYKSLSNTVGQPVKNFEIAFHHLSQKPLELMVGREEKPTDAAAVGSFTGVAGKVRFWLTETEEDVLERVPYPEEDIINCTQFSEESATATLQDDMTFSDTEVWVSMIKELHIRLFPDVEGKWLFARAKMGEYSPHHTSTSYGVTLASRFGHKLTRSEIKLDGRKVGDIFFALM